MAEFSRINYRHQSTDTGSPENNKQVKQQKTHMCRHTTFKLQKPKIKS